MSLSNNDNKFRLYDIALGVGAGAVGWESETLLRNPIDKALKTCVKKGMNFNFQDTQGGDFLPYLEKALEQNGQKGKVDIINLNKNNYEEVAKQLGICLTPPKQSPIMKILSHITRINKSIRNSFLRTKNGTNAFFNPMNNAIICNFDEFGAPIFHELSHKLNRTSNNILLKGLTKIKHPFATYGTLAVSAGAMFTNKPKDDDKEAKKNPMVFIKNHCGLLSGLAVTPYVTEECIANIRGTKIAKQAGISGDMLNKVIKTHKYSAFTYLTLIPATSLAVWTGNKIRDILYDFAHKQVEKEKAKTETKTGEVTAK